MRDKTTLMLQFDDESLLLEELKAIKKAALMDIRSIHLIRLPDKK